MNSYRTYRSAGFYGKNESQKGCGLIFNFAIQNQSITIRESMIKRELKDITVYEDIERLVNAFYDKLLHDKVTQDKFTNLDIKSHLPRIVDFWAFILIDKPGFTGNVFEKHIPLNLQPLHFEKWVSLWTDTVKEMYAGPKAELAVQRAIVLSYTFQSKLFGNDKKRML